MRDPSLGFFTLVLRGLRRHCPRCDGRGLFPKFLKMEPDCPTCGLHFERDDGYWIGAMIIGTAFTLVAFLTVFVGGVAITWPDVPWNQLLVATLLITAVTPVMSYPTSRTVWVALDLSVRSLEPDEIEYADNASGHRL